MFLLPHFVAFEIQPGRGEKVVSFAGPRRESGACYLWQSCHQRYGASLRAITADGIECGTPRPGEQHGVRGVFTERCSDCEAMFITPVVGAALCPGCELLAAGYATLSRTD